MKNGISIGSALPKLAPFRDTPALNCMRGKVAVYMVLKPCN